MLSGEKKIAVSFYPITIKVNTFSNKKDWKEEKTTSYFCKKKKEIDALKNVLILKSNPCFLRE